VAHEVFVMSNSLRNNGFSLTEVLMAAGILAIGFAFIAGMFPVGVKLTALYTAKYTTPRPPIRIV
jgi:prepilin-type N-terminal cleavage/methylation domain-containing protein